MTTPAAVAHGGAGPGPDRQHNVEAAVQRAAEILQAGGSAVEAAIEACVLLEDDPVFNAGTGAVFRNDGSILLDASLQTSDGRMGFVIAMRDTPNPIRVAADLLDEEINGLAGDGGRVWATRIGLGVSRIPMTKPRRPSEVCSEASSETEPSFRNTPPVPALNTGSSSRMTHASTAASTAEPPAWRISAARCTPASTFAFLSGPGPAPPCATAAGVAIQSPMLLPAPVARRSVATSVGG